MIIYACLCSLLVKKKIYSSKPPEILFTIFNMLGVIRHLRKPLGWLVTPYIKIDLKTIHLYTWLNWILYIYSSQACFGVWTKQILIKKGPSQGWLATITLKLDTQIFSNWILSTFWMLMCFMDIKQLQIVLSWIADQVLPSLTQAADAYLIASYVYECTVPFTVMKFKETLFIN